MPGDRAQRDRAARRELGVPGRAPAEGRRRVDVRHVQAPGEKTRQRRLRGRRRRGGVVVPDQRDAGRALVEALGVRSDDVAVDPSEAALEDLAVLVDEEVVADVVPAVREHVVALDAADDRGRPGARVRVRARGVVDDGEPRRCPRSRDGRGGCARWLPRRDARGSAASPPSRRPSADARAPCSARRTRAPGSRVRRCAPGCGRTGRSSTGCRASSRGLAARGFPRRARRPRERRRARSSSARQATSCGRRPSRSRASAARRGRSGAEAG